MDIVLCVFISYFHSILIINNYAVISYVLSSFCFHFNIVFFIIWTIWQINFLTWNMPVKWFLTLYVTTLSNDCEGMLWYVVHYICLFHSNLLYQHLHNYKRCHFNVMVDSQQKYLSKYENYEIYLSYCSNKTKYNVKMKTERWKHIRNFEPISSRADKRHDMKNAM
jgi:hypothetical protein